MKAKTMIIYRYLQHRRKQRKAVLDDILACSYDT